MSIRMRITGLAIAAACSVAPFVATGQAQQVAVTALRGVVVQVEVKKGAQRASNIGTGFVIAVDPQTTTILTARHLFYPNTGENESPFTPEPWVTFWADRLHPHQVRWIKDSPNLDLAVVEIATTQVPVAQVPKLSVRSEDVPQGEDVYTLGSDKDVWPIVKNATVAMSVKDRPDLFVYNGAGLRAGFSGAPTFDASGRLVGVHLGALEAEATYGRGAKAADMIRVMKALGVSLANLDLPNSEPAAGGLMPDIDAEWNFPVEALTRSMLDACKYELSTPPASAEFKGGSPEHYLILYGSLQTEQDRFQQCALESDIDEEDISPGKVAMTFVYKDRTLGDQKVASVRLSPNADMTELRGTATDAKNGKIVPVALKRDAIVPMASHCTVEVSPNQRTDGLATIRVTVTDVGGSTTVPGVPVFLEKENTIGQDFDFQKKTDIDGVRKVTATAGAYHVGVYLPGFGSEKMDGLRVGANQLVDVRCALNRLRP